MKRFVAVSVLVVTALLLSTVLVNAAVQNYRAHLSGKYPIPQRIDTQAKGQAIFLVKGNGDTMSYKLNVANIENVTMAHIHLLPASGTGNGPIIAWLYPSAPPAVLIPGTTNGPLANGTLNNNNILRDYNGDGTMNMADLIAAIEAGDTYVNVHTSAYPAGEIHGPVH
jgi:hypothetical protein